MPIIARNLWLLRSAIPDGSVLVSRIETPHLIWYGRSPHTERGRARLHSAIELYRPSYRSKEVMRIDFQIVPHENLEP